MSPPPRGKTGSRTSDSHSESEAKELADALRLLTTAARRRLAAHPWGHLLEGRRDSLRFEVQLPLNPRPEDFPTAAEHLGDILADSLEAALSHRLLFRPGRVFSLRDGSADGEDCEPRDSRQVFAGYGPTGIPRFEELAQLLLERQDPRIDRLYAKPARLLATTMTAKELNGGLLDAFRDLENGYRLEGQVVAGWYMVPDAAGHSTQLALTFQIVSSARAGQPRRYGLNLLGIGPDGEELTLLHDRLRDLPWAGPVRWAQQVLDSIEQAATRGPTPRGSQSGTAKKQASRKHPRQVIRQRIEGLLGGLARRLEKGDRSRSRRTRHAEQRHEEGDRPTRMALADLRKAGRENLLFDTRQGTLVALGARGRAHVFSPEGKLVTSIRYSPPAIERRRQQGRWRPASDEETALFEKHVGQLFSDPE